MNKNEHTPITFRVSKLRTLCTVVGKLKFWTSTAQSQNKHAVARVHNGSQHRTSSVANLTMKCQGLELGTDEWWVNLLSFKVIDNSSEPLLYVALLSVDGINAGLPQVVLPFHLSLQHTHDKIKYSAPAAREISSSHLTTVWHTFLIWALFCFLIPYYSAVLTKNGE